MSTATRELSMNKESLKASRVRLGSVPFLEEDDTDSFIYDDDSDSNEDESVAIDRGSELPKYVQRLEKDKRELEDELHVLRKRDASQNAQLQASQRRIEVLEASVKNAMDASDTFRREKDVVLALQTSERERMASLVALLEEAQTRYEDAERARESAVFQLSSLQAARAEVSSQQLLPREATSSRNSSKIEQSSSALITPNVFHCGSHAVNERIEKYKRDMELLRQRLELVEEQAEERQKLAVSLALRDAQADYSVIVERMQSECDSRISQWQHEEAVRAKEKEHALEEDRYSVRLEMKQALQRPMIDERVSSLQAQAELDAGVSGSSYDDSDFSVGTLDEVLVRMQLDQVRSRRFEALKKTLLIRRAKLQQASKEFFCRWKLQTTTVRMLRLNAVLHMHRVALHLCARKKLASFTEWKMQTRQLQAHTFQKQALSCWNRMLAVERMAHVFQQSMMKRTARRFYRWRFKTSTTSDEPKHKTSNPGDDSEAMQSLQQEIKKLHDQLASSKSEAWRYKRQLLKQFL